MSTMGGGTEASEELERLRSILEATTDMVGIADPEGRILYENAAIREFMGRPGAVDVEGVSIADHHTPDELERFLPNALATAARDGSWSGEVVWQSPDGRRIQTHQLVLAHKNSEGEVEYYSTITRDITARKQIEQQILALNRTLEQRVAERTARAQQYLDLAPVFFVALDVDGRVTLINRRGCEIVGDREENILGTNWFEEFLPEEKVEHVSAVFQDLMAGRIQLRERYENVLRTRGGDLRTIAWTSSLLRDDSGAIVGTLGSGTDVTEKRRAEEVLRARESQLRLITDSLPVMVARVSREGRYVFNNAAYERVFGISREALRGRLVSDFLDEETFAVAKPHLEEALAGRAASFGSQIVDKDGRVRDIDVSFVPDRDESGAVVGFFALIADITERKQLESALRQSQKMEAVGQLASGVAHDFNNLLMGIGGCAQIALARLEPGHPARDLVDEIRTAAKHGAGITRQLLDFSRKTELGIADVEIDDIVAANESMLKSLLGGSITLALDLAADGEQVRVGRGQIEQVLLNLLGNARDAMPGGGRVGIKTEVVELEGTCSCGGLGPGRYVTLSVSDTGVGMEPSVRDRVFEPFFTTKEAGKGTGLGLPMVWGMVTKQGGCVEVQSEVGAGTTVIVHWPRGEAESSTSASSAGGEGIRAVSGSETVLVVEDDRLVLLTVREHLRGWGYDVLEAADGAEAVRQARQHRGPLPLIVCDVVLPGTSGPEVAGAVRELHPEVNVIFMSGHSLDMLVDAGHLQRDQSVLQKPFTGPQLQERVRAVLGESAVQ